MHAKNVSPIHVQLGYFIKRGLEQRQHLSSTSTMLTDIVILFLSQEIFQPTSLSGFSHKSLLNNEFMFQSLAVLCCFVFVFMCVYMYVHVSTWMRPYQGREFFQISFIRKDYPELLVKILYQITYTLIMLRTEKTNRQKREGRRQRLD